MIGDLALEDIVGDPCLLYCMVFSRVFVLVCDRGDHIELSTINITGNSDMLTYLNESFTIVGD